MFRVLICAALLCIVPVAAFAQAGQPRISWQGLLTDDGGTPLAGPVDLEFKFYYESSGGSEVWTFDTTGVELDGGIANVDIPILRLHTANPLEVERQVYLGVSIDGTTELPRTPITSAPSALTLKVPARIVGDRSGTVTSSLLEVLNKGNGTGLRLNSWNGSNIYATAGGNRSIYAETSHSNGAAVEGKNTSATGYTWGVQGRSASNLGTGVLGRADALTGTTAGVFGISNSSDGFGGRFEGGRGISVEGHPTADHGGYVTAYIGLFENTNGGVSDDGIAIKVGTTGDPGVGVNFVGFFDGDEDLIGQIEGNGTGGVAFNTSGADYAESLPIVVGEGRLEPGDVVGVHAGAVSRRTEGADQLLVVTDRAAIIGNTPKGEESLNRVPVSLIGQVAVKITGPVNSGDYIVSSGHNDGTTVAVPPSDLSVEQIPRLIGRAWESSPDTGVRRVNVVVGLDRTEAATELLQRQDRSIRDLEEKVEFLLKRLQDDSESASATAAR